MQTTLASRAVAATPGPAARVGDDPRVDASHPSDDEVEAARLAARLIEIAHGEELELPAFPSLAARVLNIVEAAEPSMRELVSVIEQDAMISAQVLRLAGSAYYSRGNEVTSVQQATTRLGMRAVATVAIGAATRALLDAQERQSNDCFKELWAAIGDHSMYTAQASRWLATKLKRGRPDEAFLSGLMHDLGKMVALHTAGHMVLTGDLAATIAPALLDAVLESVHVQLGSELCAFWGLPGQVAYVCDQHHAVDPPAIPLNDVLHVVRVVSGFHDVHENPSPHPGVTAELFSSGRALGLEGQELDEVGAQLAALAVS